MREYGAPNPTYERRKNAKPPLCIACGKKPAVPGKGRCVDHLKKEKKDRRKTRAREYEASGDIDTGDGNIISDLAEIPYKHPIIAKKKRLGVKWLGAKKKKPAA
jgi:hypothetical protein